jgi:hypothetical protein
MENKTINETVMILFSFNSIDRELTKYENFQWFCRISELEEINDLFWRL